jgi:hypothetical protein
MNCKGCQGSGLETILITVQHLPEGTEKETQSP